MNNDSKTNIFNIVLMAIFVAAAVVGLIVFATNKPKNNSAAGASGTITVWGTLDDALFREAAGRTSEAMKEISEIQVNYKKFSEENFEFELLDALASGKGPDAIILDDANVVRQHERLLTVSFENFPPADFNQIYADSAHVFLLKNQVVAFPLFIDPMIMYYNKDILASHFMVYPPTTWLEMIESAAGLTVKSDSGIIEKSALAFGTQQNIPHANDLLVLLALQQGNPLVAMDMAGKFFSLIDEAGLQGQEFPVGKSLQLFASFADIAQPHYTWNASLPNAEDMFLAGDLAFYIGYASEFRDLVQKNPNLNFGVTVVPQVSDTSTKVTLGHVQAMGALKSSKNPAATFAVMNAFSSDAGSALFAEVFAGSPVRKSLLAQKMNDPIIDVFQRSAIIARTWLNPDAVRVREIFKNLIIDVNAGRDNTDALVNAVADAVQDLLDTRLNKDIPTP